MVPRDAVEAISEEDHESGLRYLEAIPERRRSEPTEDAAASNHQAAAEKLRRSGPCPRGLGPDLRRLVRLRQRLLLGLKRSK